jgi:hypothetical protein
MSSVKACDPSHCRCPLFPLQPDSLPQAVTVHEAIHDLPLLLGGDGGRSMPAGRACLPYTAAAADQSRYVQYMRRGAPPLVLSHHQRRPCERGDPSCCLPALPACTFHLASPPQPLSRSRSCPTVLHATPAA